MLDTEKYWWWFLNSLYLLSLYYFVTELYVSLVEYFSSQRNEFYYYESLALKIVKNKRYEKECKPIIKRNKNDDNGGAEYLDLMAENVLKPIHF